MMVFVAFFLFFFGMAFTLRYPLYFVDCHCFLFFRTLLVIRRMW
jgi:hypothetical protein